MGQTQESSDFKYSLPPWGDLILGSKAELQALGIGVGMAFPGEPDGPKRRLYCLDPRGFRARVERWRFGEDHFSCAIPFPDRDSSPPRPDPAEVAPGVLCSSTCHWFDEYVGTAEALVAAGLVQPNHFPGLPGMRKVCVTVLPDGTPLGGAPTANQPEAAGAPGARTITKAGRKAYRVRVRVPDDVRAARYDENRRLDAEHNAWLLSLPRPRPLVAPDREVAAREQRQQLRLVWSRPAPTFSLR
jgi:hypothetical protein